MFQVSFHQQPAGSLLTRSQRLKGAIDNRIAEEQARQRQAALSASSTRTAPGQPRRNQNGTSARRPSRQRETLDVSTEKGPDPAEFEPEFTVGDDESAVPSRTVTPLPEVRGAKEKPEEKAGETMKDTEASTQEAAESKPENINDAAPPPSKSPELPTEVRVKLRKLDRLEGRYQ